MQSKTMKEVLDEAREIYNKTMCGGAGCCGDLDGALEYLDGAVGEMIQNIIKGLFIRPVSFQQWV